MECVEREDGTLSEVLNIVIERDIEMSTRDGIMLRGDVYRPSEGRPTIAPDR